jgi:hypothetical protein
MYNSTRRLTVLTAVVLPIVTLTTAALADNDKTYPGAMCRSFSSATVELRTDGALMNIGRDETTFICPAVKDEMKFDPSFARMTVVEDGTNQVRCELVSRGPEGTPEMTSGSGFRKSQKIVQTSPLQLVVVYTWGDGGDFDAIEDTTSHGYLFFRCRMPGATGGPAGGPPNQFSGVITYKVAEND